MKYQMLRLAKGRSLTYLPLLVIPSIISALVFCNHLFAVLDAGKNILLFFVAFLEILKLDDSNRSNIPGYTFAFTLIFLFLSLCLVSNAYQTSDPLCIIVTFFNSMLLNIFTFITILAIEQC